MTVVPEEVLFLQQFATDYESAVLSGAKPYENDLPDYNALYGELCIWKHMWANKEGDFPKQPAEAFKYTTDFPNIRTLIQLICTFPVTTSTAERSFSALRRIKSYLRCTMSEERLNGLASLHINREISEKLNPEEVLEMFAKKHKRKLSLSLDQQ